MKVSVIIPTYNGSNKIGRLLASLEQQNFQDFETIIIVDGSTDDTVNVLKTGKWRLQSMKIIEQENKGRAGARNAGAWAAKGELLIFFDDDVIVNKDCINRYRLFFQNSLANQQIVVGALHAAMDNQESEVMRFSEYLGLKWNAGIRNQYNQEQKLYQVYLTAANFGISSNCFSGLNGFSEKLNDAEDKDFAIRAIKNGIDIIYAEEMIVSHFLQSTFIGIVKRWREYYKANAILGELHGIGSNFSYSFKKPFYLPFSFSFWLLLFERGAFFWLPRRIRYKLYIVVLTALSYYYPNRVL